MLLKIYDIDSWKNFFDLIHDSTSSIMLELDQEKCSISVLNDSHVCFYMVEYSKYFFEEYDVDDKENIFIEVADFYPILKSARNGESLEITTHDNMIKIILEKDLNRRVFEIPIAEDYGQSPVPPDVPTTIIFELPLKDLKQPCHDLDKICKTDRFKMTVSDEIFEVDSPVDSMTKYNQRMIVDNEGGSAECTINLRYIDDLQKLSKISEIVTFRIGNDMPLCWNISSPIGDVKVEGLIAPILDDEV